VVAGRKSKATRCSDGKWVFHNETIEAKIILQIFRKDARAIRRFSCLQDMGIPKGKRISFVKVDSGYNHVKVCSDDLQDGYMLDEQECIFGCYRGFDFLGRYLEEFLDDLNADNACFLLNLLSDELSSDVRFSG